MIDIEEIRKNPHNQNWHQICWHETLSEEFMIEFKDFLNFENIIIKQKLSEKFIVDNIITDYSQEIVALVFQYQKLSEALCEEYIGKAYTLKIILIHQKLSEKFLYKHGKNFNFHHFELISEYQILSEDFIREFKGMVNWSNISAYQKLSEDFIREFENRISWNVIGHNNLSIYFVKDFKHKVNLYHLLYSFNLSKDIIADLLPLSSFYIKVLLSNNRLSKEIKNYCRMFL
jgi:hypothetical protein